jgi:hypothetical protein
LLIVEGIGQPSPASGVQRQLRFLTGVGEKPPLGGGILTDFPKDGVGPDGHETADEEIEEELPEIRMQPVCRRGRGGDGQEDRGQVAVDEPRDEYPA